MSAPRGGEALRRFKRLAQATVVATFALVVVGGIVRVSDSGLGCGPSGSGAHGWPLCAGHVIPLIGGDQALVIEFTHRALAGIVALMIGGLVFIAVRHLRDLRWPVRLTATAGTLVLIQAGLGGLTVEYNLHELLVAAHLCLAMLLLGLTLWIVVRSSDEERRAEGKEPRRPNPSLKPFATVAAALLLGAIVAGGYMAGTEKMGADGGVSQNGAHMACGNVFPTCLDGAFMPFGVSELTDIHLTHRLLVYLATAAIIALLIAGWRRRAEARLLVLTAVLLVAQLLLGAVNVWAGEHAGLIAGHLALGTALWLSVLYIGYTQALEPAYGAEESADEVRRASAATA